MASLTLPAVHKQKLYVYFYLPNSTITAVPWAMPNSADYIELNTLEIEVKFDPGVQQKLYESLAGHFEAAIKTARDEFVAKVNQLEETRAKYLALEG